MKNLHSNIIKMSNNRKMTLSDEVAINYDFVFSIINKFTSDLDTKYINAKTMTELIVSTTKPIMKLNDIYYYISDYCATRISVHPDYNKLASRVCVERLHHDTPLKFLDVVNKLYNNKNSKKEPCPLVSDELYEIVQKHSDEIQSHIVPDRDYLLDYFSIRTLERSYLFRTHDPAALKYYKDERTGKLIERPQHMFMRVALGIHGYDLERVFETYEFMSTKYFTHATPTLFNSGTRRAQFSSCFLLHTPDSIEGIAELWKRVAFISKWAGGIGIDATSVRGRGSLINGTNGKSDGIIPFCILLNYLGKYINQGGKRNGSIACFVENTEVFTTNAGVKKIQDVKVGDLVVTHKNRVRPVTQVHKNPIKDRKIYKLEVEKNKDIYVTGNHKFWSFYTKKYKSNKISNGWNSVEDLKTLMDNKKTTRQTCYISIPKSTDIVDTKNYKIDVMDYKDVICVDTINEIMETNSKQVISISQTINKLGHKTASHSQPINRIWNITEDFANLIGMWLGDGHIKKSKRNGIILGIELTVHKDNKDEIDYFTKICKNIFNCNITSNTSKTRNITSIRVNSRIVGLIFAHLFGCYFDGKKLPNMVFSWPKNLVNNLMAGLITTDGHIEKTKSNASLGMSNEKLMNQLYHLCRNNGIDVSLKKGTIGKGMTCNPYKMCIPLRKDIISRTHKLYNDDRLDKCADKMDAVDDNDVYLKILNITETDRNDDYVYTLGVEEDHSYTVEGLLAQNCYLQPWHTDIYQFCELRKNTKDEDTKARDLFLAVWVPDLFMKRVQEEGNWTLMCPNDCPGLVTAYGDEFEKLYVKYEQDENIKKKTVKALDLFYHIMECQMETGMPYMTYKDNVNHKSNQMNIGPIRSSNLCAEIVEYTDDNNVAVCNLASLCLPKYLEKDSDGKLTYNFEKLMKVARIVTRNLDNIITRNYYPTPETKASNFKNRPIGIGVQGLVDVYQKLGMAFGSKEAYLMNRKIFETIYFGALTESCLLSKERGRYESFDGSPFSKGQLQFHLWGKDESYSTMGYDWKSLIEDIKTHGTRNSLLTAVMPTATTSQIMCNSESIEAPMSNIYIRSTLAGEFIVINESLVQDLIKLGLWSEDMRKLLIIRNGSIQDIDGIPTHIKEIYKTAFEIRQKDIIMQAAERGPFIDQSQSMNLFMAESNFDILMSCHFEGWKRGLKTGMYYLRTRPSVDPIQFGIDIEEVNKLTNAFGKDKSPKGPDTPKLVSDEPEPDFELEEFEEVKACKLLRPGMKLEDCTVCSG